MKTAERFVIVILLLTMIGGGAWIYFAVQYKQEEVKIAVAKGEYEIPLKQEEVKTVNDNWRVIYPNTVPITIGSTTVEASVADSLPERIQGLSNTPYLPMEVVKLFVFGAPGQHSIWMKDMNYALDIMWADQVGKIVHIEKNVSPDSFPSSFSSPIPAWYVIEAAAGFIDTNQVTIGNEVVFSN
jgi:uncharacterized membrane protein (UPF0127 family)